MTAPDLARVGTYEFFAWLAANRPALMAGSVGTPYSTLVLQVADRVGFRSARSAESTERYLGALMAFIAAPPPAPAPLPVAFAGPEPDAPPAHVGDPWPYHLCSPAVEWRAPLVFADLCDASFYGMHGASVVDGILDHPPPAPPAPLPPFIPAFTREPEPEPIRSVVVRWLVAAALAVAVLVGITRLPAVPSALNPPPLP